MDVSDFPITFECIYGCAHTQVTKVTYYSFWHANKCQAQVMKQGDTWVLGLINNQHYSVTSKMFCIDSKVFDLYAPKENVGCLFPDVILKLN